MQGQAQWDPGTANPTDLVDPRAPVPATRGRTPLRIITACGEFTILAEATVDVAAQQHARPDGSLSHVLDLQVLAGSAVVGGYDARTLTAGMRLRLVRDGAGAVRVEVPAP